jgi:nucleoside-diphosphate-sugar epimerase
MKVLITGGAGYVGSLLAPELMQRGHEVRVLDNLMYGQLSLLHCFVDGQFRFIRGDIRDKEAVRSAVQGVDHIVHLAAIVGAPACRKDERLAWEVNVQGTIDVGECRKSSQGFIFASSCSNYGAVEGVCTEDTPLNPLSTYSITKTEAEARVLRSGNAVVYRFATGFGLSPRLRIDLMVNDFVFRAVKHGALVVYTKDSRRSFIHARDMARSLAFAVENYDRLVGEGGNVFNVGNEALNYTKEQVALKVRDRLDFCLHFADAGTELDPRDYKVSYEKIRSQGFETAVSLEQGIDELVHGYRMVSLRNPFSNVEE